MNLKGTSLIGFSSASGNGGVFHAVNPATGEQLEPGCVSATSADVDAATQLASEAFREYSLVSGKQKAVFLRRIAENTEVSNSEIVELANLETALPLPRLQSELVRTCNQLRLFADLVGEGSWVDARIDHADLQRKPVPKPDVRSMLRPLGPVAVFGSSNFPLAFSVAGGDTASALAAGCPVIVKAHPAHPGTSELVGGALQRAVRQSGLPEGMFSLLFDAGYDAGAALVRHPLVKAVAFTGSRKGGLALVNIAAARPEPIPVYAEMGSVNPVFVLPEALASRHAAIAAGLHTSVTIGAGQFCTNPGLLFIRSGEAARLFLQQLEKHMRDTPPGIMLTNGIATSYRAGVKAFGATHGVHTHVHGNSPDGSSRCGAAMFSTDGATFLANPGLMEEVFGPSTLVVHYDRDTQLQKIVEALEGQLTATVHGTVEDLETHRDLLNMLERKVGRIVLHGFPTGVEVCHAMVHGGPYPATSDGRSTSVGTRAIQRFTRPVCYQDFDDFMLPDELKNDNPLAVWRLVDGRMMR